MDGVPGAWDESDRVCVGRGICGEVEVLGDGEGVDWGVKRRKYWVEGERMGRC